MKALLLAGGMGTRLAPITDHIPKCLVPIQHIPLIDYWLAQLVAQDIKDILVNTHYLADKVNAYLKASKWAPYITMVHEPVLLGTGGTLQKNQAFFEDKTFFVAHADNLTVIDIPAYYAHHLKRPEGVDITMMTFTTDTPETCGIVEVDERGVVKQFHEKVKNPPNNQANGAIFIMEPSIFDVLNQIEKPLIEISCDLLPRYLNKMQIWQNEIYLRDIGNPTSLAQANEDILSHPALARLYDSLRFS